MRLEGKKTIVTGGGGEKGIGRAIVRAFAREGADVCVVGCNVKAGQAAAQEVRELGGNALQMQCDISKMGDIEKTVAAVIREWGRIDVLVNNAGIAIPSPFLDVTPEMAQKVWGVNLFGTFFMSRQVARHMVERSKQLGYKPGAPIVGKIINISSFSEDVGTFNVSHYAATKGAIKMLTRCWATELAQHGIVVNAIGAGFVETNIVDAPHEDYVKLGRAIPLGRVGTPEDIAGAAVFLASSYSDYATGSTIMVDGGFAVCRSNQPD